MDVFKDWMSEDLVKYIRVGIDDASKKEGYPSFARFLRDFALLSIHLMINQHEQPKIAITFAL